MSGDTAVSVVVPTRDRTTRLLLTLTALGRQTLGRERFEVVLVDDALRPGAVAQVLSALPPGLRVRTAATGGRGAAHARNTGARSARGELLLFLDDDTVAGPGLLETHLAAHARTGTAVLHSAVTDLSAFALTPDPDPIRPALVGARGRRIEPATLARLDTAVPLLGPRRSFIERTARRVIRSPGHPALHWLVCIGTATSVRRTLFERVGGFDEHYGELWGGEDLELGLRLAAAGARFGLLDPVSYHLPTARRDTGDLLPRFWQRVADRHGDPRLADVGTYLTGRLPLAELAERLGPPTGLSLRGWSPGGASLDGLSPDGLSPGGLSPDGVPSVGLSPGGVSSGGLSQAALPPVGVSLADLLPAGVSPADPSPAGVSPADPSPASVLPADLPPADFPPAGHPPVGVPQAGLPLNNPPVAGAAS
ncbi:glycosyltransferase family 2 protein [Streptomyces sp. DSM 15324]|uniref:glycosyltransferase family 2 protein n=1 Tax=Streptomyces sp. DSM 15324 TaxID=1739111 RepID=UPI000749A062|nr:glycosyltransferase [Streptomyces sp. DSM 15324]KUO10112.1 hypothetical protein AQJ58_21945 [Streptomyces sp. DSM 15324]